MHNDIGICLSHNFYCTNFPYIQYITTIEIIILLLYSIHITYIILYCFLCAEYWYYNMNNFKLFFMHFIFKNLELISILWKKESPRIFQTCVDIWDATFIKQYMLFMECRDTQATRQKYYIPNTFESHLVKKKTLLKRTDIIHHKHQFATQISYKCLKY